MKVTEKVLDHDGGITTKIKWCNGYGDRWKTNWHGLPVGGTVKYDVYGRGSLE